MQNLGRYYRKIVVRRIAKKSHRIVTCSEYSKNQIVALFGIDPAKIVVIPNVVGEEWFAECPKPDVATPYVLAVAGEAPSKNTRRLIEAMALLHARMPQLTLKIAGVSSRFHATFVELANRCGLGSRVQLLPYLNDTELRVTYRELRRLCAHRWPKVSASPYWKPWQPAFPYPAAMRLRCRKWPAIALCTSIHSIPLKWLKQSKPRWIGP